MSRDCPLKGRQLACEKCCVVVPGWHREQGPLHRQPNSATDPCPVNVLEETLDCILVGLHLLADRLELLHDDVVKHVNNLKGKCTNTYHRATIFKEIIRYQVWNDYEKLNNFLTCSGATNGSVNSSLMRWLNDPEDE